jgi:hypothetical protein
MSIVCDVNATLLFTIQQNSTFPICEAPIACMPHNTLYGNAATKHHVVTLLYFCCCRRRARAIAARLEAGMSSINDFYATYIQPI